MCPVHSILIDFGKGKTKSKAKDCRLTLISNLVKSKPLNARPSTNKSLNFFVKLQSYARSVKRIDLPLDI